MNEELKKHFKPEFLNRVDEQRIGVPSSRSPSCCRSWTCFVKRQADRLLDRDMTVELTLAAKEQLIKVGFDPALGARRFAARCSTRSRTSCPSTSCR